MVKPFCSKDLDFRSLADHIRDLGQCVTLYPNIPKDTAFGEFYSPRGTIEFKPCERKLPLFTHYVPLLRSK